MSRLWSRPSRLVESRPGGSHHLRRINHGSSAGGSLPVVVGAMVGSRAGGGRSLRDHDAEPVVWGPTPCCAAFQTKRGPWNLCFRGHCREHLDAGREMGAWLESLRTRCRVPRSRRRRLHRKVRRGFLDASKSAAVVAPLATGLACSLPILIDCYTRLARRRQAYRASRRGGSGEGTLL